MKYFVVPHLAHVLLLRICLVQTLRGYAFQSTLITLRPFLTGLARCYNVASSCSGQHCGTFEDNNYVDFDHECRKSTRTATSNNLTNRRQWMLRTAQAVATPFLLPSPSYASPETVTATSEVGIITGSLDRFNPNGSNMPSQTTVTRARSVVPTSAVCDRAVSVWKEPNRNRLVYILGTAHISKVSAQLAQQLVQDVHPDAVFVELDWKRVGGVNRYNSNAKDPSSALSSSTSDIATTSSVARSDNGSWMVPASTTTSTSLAVSSRYTNDNTSVWLATEPTSSMTSPSSIVIAPDIASPSATGDSEATMGMGSSLVPMSGGGGGGFWSGVRQRALGVASSVVGSALKNMYRNLGDAGFNPGEEFAVAVAEAQRIGAAVVLGDQDVELTLQRLTQALAVTDLNKLNDPQLQSKMNELLGAPSQQTIPDGDLGSPEFRQELTTFVETLKSRENVRALMAQLKELAPALVQVMLTERDAYMARGLDTLNQFECIVAVMGIAHMDGVERNLRERSWQPVMLNCPL